MIDCKIVTPEGVAYSDQIDQITIPTEAGEITVLPNHTALVSLLKPGVARIKKESVTKSFDLTKGILEVRPNSQVIVLAESAKNIS